MLRKVFCTPIFAEAQFAFLALIFLGGQNDIASFVGWSQSLISLRFSSFYAFRRHAIKNGIEQGHGTQPNRSGMKDLWPSASRSALTAISLF